MVILDCKSSKIMFSIRELKKLSESFEKDGGGDVQEFLLYVASQDYAELKESVRALVNGMTELTVTFPDMGKDKTDVAKFINFMHRRLLTSDFLDVVADTISADDFVGEK